MKKTLFILIIFVISLFIEVIPLFCKDTYTYCYENTKKLSEQDAKDLAFRHAAKNAVESSQVFINSTATVKNGILYNEVLEFSIEGLLKISDFYFFEENSKICCTIEGFVSDDEFGYKRLIDKESNKILQKIIEKTVRKMLTTYITKKDIDRLLKSKRYEMKFDFERLVLDIIENKSFNEELSNIKGSSDSTDRIIEKIYNKKSVFGYKKGEFDFKDNNILVEKSVQEFFFYLEENLVEKLNGKKLEILAIGYADEIPVNIYGLPFNFPRILYIPDEEGCPNYEKTENNTSPPQPVYLLPDTFKWHKIGTSEKLKFLNGQFINKRIYDNCQLSFSRGFFVMKYLKQFSQEMRLNNKNICFSYSGKGVHSKNVLNDDKKRKVMIILRQSRI